MNTIRVVIFLRSFFHQDSFIEVTNVSMSVLIQIINPNALHVSCNERLNSEIIGIFPVSFIRTGICSYHRKTRPMHGRLATNVTMS